MLLTTQYLDEADRLADRIAVIDDGKVIAEGTADELKDRVGGERVEVKLDRRRPRRSTRARALAGMAADASADRGDVVRVTVHQRNGAVMEAARRLDQAGVDVEDIAVRRPTLDDVFLTLTGHTAEEAADSVDPKSRREDGGGGMTRLVNDTLVMAERNLVRLPRAPDMLLAFTVQPIMFVLLFAYVFGGAIGTPGYDSYIDFLIPGIIAQNIAFGGFATALGLAEDMGKGLIDRFRSLPTARASVLAGRALADVATNTLSVVVLLVTGVIIGFGFDANVAEIFAGFGLLLLFGFASSWIFALIGLSVSSPEAANGVGFTLIFPITFISSAFVPVESMPSGLEEVAERQPVQRRRRRDAGAVARRPGGQQHLAVGRLVRRPHRDLRPAGRREVPQDRLEVGPPRARARPERSGRVPACPQHVTCRPWQRARRRTAAGAGSAPARRCARARASSTRARR